MKIDASDVSIVSEIVYSTAEHEILLSFNCDDQAAMFDEWWRSKGLNAFLKWAARAARATRTSTSTNDEHGHEHHYCRGEIQRLKAVIEAYSQICVAYLIGIQPIDSALELVREYNEAARAAGGDG